jgi:hypothetical protein
MASPWSAWGTRRTASWRPKPGPRAASVSSLAGEGELVAFPARRYRQRRIGGAALDVFDDEPNVPDALKRLSNTVLTPHVAGLGSARHVSR